MVCTCDWLRAASISSGSLIHSMPARTMPKLCAIATTPSATEHRDAVHPPAHGLRRRQQHAVVPMVMIGMSSSSARATIMIAVKG